MTTLFRPSRVPRRPSSAASSRQLSVCNRPRLDPVLGSAPANFRQQRDEVLLHPFLIFVFDQRPGMNRGRPFAVMLTSDEPEWVATIHHVCIEHVQRIGVIGPYE